MTGTPVVMNSFAGGIVNRTDEASLQDDEMQDCINFVYGVDGTLIGRPPICVRDDTGLEAITERMRLLHWTVLVQDKSFFPVLIGSNNNGTYAYYGGVWNEISGVEVEDFVTYGNTNNLAFFPRNIHDLTLEGGTWAYGDAAIDHDSLTPPGNTMCVHKERIWIAGDPEFPSRLYYSKITPDGSNDDWEQTSSTTSSGFVDVAPGNGQGITKIIEYSDAIVIFKDDSTFILNYDGVVSRGQLVQVNNVIGAQNNQCVIEYENILFVYHQGKVYAFANGNFQQINKKLRFDGDPNFTSTLSETLLMSMVGDNLVVRNYENIYVYSTFTTGWVRWITDFPVGNFVQRPIFVGDEIPYFFVSSVDPDDTQVYDFHYTWTADRSEDMDCKLVTKIFDYGVPYAFKRLFWWGVDATTNLTLRGSAHPIVASFTPTWGDVDDYTWGDLSDNTWGSLLATPPDVISPDSDPGYGNQYRRFYKWLKGLRFRQIYFTVVMWADGSSNNGPVRLASIVPFITAHETVVKKAS